MHGIHSSLIHLTKSVMKIWRITLEVNTNKGIEKIGLVNVNIENTSWKVRAYGIYAWVLCKHGTKHFPYGIVLGKYILRHLSFFHPFISCLSEILKCQNTPLHTTKWQRKRRILFGMYNWKWMNLSKIRQDKNVSDKKYNLSLRLVLFCSLPRFF